MIAVEPEMSRRRQASLLMTVVAVAGVGLCTRVGVASGLLTAETRNPQAPAFSLTTLNGRRITLAGFRGKVVLLNFWATWCGPCRKEIPEFIKLQTQYAPAGLQIIGLSLDDDAQPVREFYKRFGMNYPVAMADERVGLLYRGTTVVPTTIVIGRDGRIAGRVLGAIKPGSFTEEIRSLLASRKVKAE